MKKNLFLFALGLLTFMPAQAQQWGNRKTPSTSDAINRNIESAKRKMQTEIHAQEKVQFEQSFKDAMESAKGYEEGECWEDALNKYEEAAKLNCKYDYSDQRQITRKINDLYVKAGRTEEGPSILNNDKVTLADYSKYRYVRENPVYVNKKETTTRIVRVACSDKETRLEFEIEAAFANYWASVSDKSFIMGNKGDKLTLEATENISTAPARTYIPWTYQKLRFVLIFPALPEETDEFHFIEPATTWQFRNIKCK